MTAENEDVRIIEEKHNGIVDVATNDDALDVVAEEVNDEDSEKIQIKKKPSYFTSPFSRKKIVMNLISSPLTGQIISIVPQTYDIDYSQFPTLLRTEVWFDFTVPNYEQMANYRLNSSFYNQVAKRNIIDNNRMRMFFIRNHLKDWNLLNDDESKIELLFNKDGTLTNESLDVVCSLFPTLIDVVMTTFEKTYLLIG